VRQASGQSTSSLPHPAVVETASLASAWDVGDVAEATEPATGTVNHTLLLTTSRGRFVLRGYRHREREPVEREHAVIEHVRARGLPAVAPLPLLGGSRGSHASRDHTILERDGRFYALFPWARGWQVPRAALGPAEAAAMGAFLARLHRALADFPADRVSIPRRSYAFTRSKTLARIDELAGIVRAGAATDPLAPTMLARLAAQRAHVETLPDAVDVSWGGLEEQVIHGDYQETNLFFADGPHGLGAADESRGADGQYGGCAVSAIIDWDQTHLAPRAREVIRALDYAFGFEPRTCRAFLRAYRTEEPLPLEELDIAAAAHNTLASHGLWLYEAHYAEGNHRVTRLLEDAGTFVLSAERWQRARA
jgi:homoserine kinase type II